MPAKRIRFTKGELEVLASCLGFALAGDVNGGPLDPGPDYGHEGQPRYERAVTRRARLARNALTKAQTILARRG